MDFCLVRQALLHLRPRLAQGPATRSRLSDLGGAAVTRWRRPRWRRPLREAEARQAQNTLGHCFNPSPPNRAQKLREQAVADWGNSQKPRELGELHKSGVQQQGGPPRLASCSPHAFPSPLPGLLRRHRHLLGSHRERTSAPQGTVLLKWKVPHSAPCMQQTPDSLASRRG